MVCEVLGGDGEKARVALTCEGICMGRRGRGYKDYDQRVVTVLLPVTSDAVRAML
jgi:hypothetical protein